jgi:hypothetical protein
MEAQDQWSGRLNHLSALPLDWTAAQSAMSKGQEKTLWTTGNEPQ